MTKTFQRDAALLLVLLFAGPASFCRADDPWEPYRFLIGEWVSVGDPAKGSGKFTLQPDLQGKVLIRKNHAEYPASGTRPAVSHDDLMVIYRGEAGQPEKAIYFDSEGHTIHYTASFSSDKQTLTFLSEPAPAGPRFRLSYTKAESGSVAIKFEIAPPGQPEGFKTYLEGTVKRSGLARSEPARP